MTKSIFIPWQLPSICLNAALLIPSDKHYNTAKLDHLADTYSFRNFGYFSRTPTLFSASYGLPRTFDFPYLMASFRSCRPRRKMSPFISAHIIQTVDSPIALDLWNDRTNCSRSRTLRSVKAKHIWKLRRLLCLKEPLSRSSIGYSASSCPNHLKLARRLYRMLFRHFLYAISHLCIFL